MIFMHTSLWRWLDVVSVALDAVHGMHPLVWFVFFVAYIGCGCGCGCISKPTPTSPLAGKFISLSVRRYFVEPSGHQVITKQLHDTSGAHHHLPSHHHNLHSHVKRTCGFVSPFSSHHMHIDMAIVTHELCLFSVMSPMSTMALRICLGCLCVHVSVCCLCVLFWSCSYHASFNEWYTMSTIILNWL